MSNTQAFKGYDDELEEPSSNCDRVEFRLVYGTSWEGLSIRCIYYDVHGNIVGYDKKPLTPLSGTREEAIGYLVDMMKNIDEMLEGAQKPIMKESELEALLG